MSAKKSYLKLIAVCIIIIGPLLAVLQIQFGERAGVKAEAQRQLTHVSNELKQAEVVKDVSINHEEDILLLENAVPLGQSHDTLLLTVSDVAENYGARVVEFNLTSGEDSLTELQLARYRSNMQNFEVTFSGVDYENLSSFLQALRESRRPIQVIEWQFNSVQSTLTVLGRFMFIEEYATF